MFRADDGSEIPCLPTCTLRGRRGGEEWNPGRRLWSLVPVLCLLNSVRIDSDFVSPALSGATGGPLDSGSLSTALWQQSEALEGEERRGPPPSRNRAVAPGLQAGDTVRQKQQQQQQQQQQQRSVIM